MAHRSTGSVPLRNVLASRIRQAREKRGWSQSDLARALQLVGWDAGRTLVTKIELRERCLTDYELIVLARVLSVSLDDLTRGAYKEALQMTQTVDGTANGETVKN